jgi:enoyl-CoA hydratase/carnithine racemase
VTNTYEQIELSVESNIATIKLNRPERFNALAVVSWRSLGVRWMR